MEPEGDAAFWGLFSQQNRPVSQRFWGDLAGPAAAKQEVQKNNQNSQAAEDATQSCSLVLFPRIQPKLTRGKKKKPSCRTSSKHEHAPILWFCYCLGEGGGVRDILECNKAKLKLTWTPSTLIRNTLLIVSALFCCQKLLKSSKHVMLLLPARF